MHRDLALFLKDVWAEVTKPENNVFQQIEAANRNIAMRRRRTSIDSPEIADDGSARRIHRAVYTVYNRFESKHAGLPQKVVPSWLEALNKIGQGVTKRRLQSGREFMDFDPVYARYCSKKA